MWGFTTRRPKRENDRAVTEAFTFEHGGTLLCGSRDGMDNGRSFEQHANLPPEQFTQTRLGEKAVTSDSSGAVAGGLHSRQRDESAGFGRRPFWAADRLSFQHELPRFSRHLYDNATLLGLKRAGKGRHSNIGTLNPLTLPWPATAPR